MEDARHATQVPRRVPQSPIALVRVVEAVAKTASDLGITPACLHGWVKQDRIDRGENPGVSAVESRELRKAKRRIRELEDEVEILRRANAMLGSAAQHPKGSTR